MSDISAISPFAPPAPASSAPTANGMGDQLGADVFLQLLVAQLKYQDPTSPSDGTEFLAQTAQFTMVEKLTSLAEQAEASAVVDRNLAAASMVGRNVAYLDANGDTTPGVVEAARLGSAGPVLVIDGIDVPFDRVSIVLAPTPVLAPAPPAPKAPASPPRDDAVATSSQSSETTGTDAVATTTTTQTMDGTASDNPTPGTTDDAIGAV